MARLESVVRARRSLSALSAICRRLSMSCISMLGTVTTDVRLDDVLLFNGDGGFMAPMRMHSAWIGLTRVLMTG